MDVNLIVFDFLCVSGYLHDGQKRTGFKDAEM